ncbi:MAG: Glu/Leu/Phe/Val dehydrogenase [Nocardioidaceae bacterium]|nr:Glu/Leu/Phe/Val dehydrogenase [Nocardioidaceae bacterium]
MEVVHSWLVTAARSGVFARQSQHEQVVFSSDRHTGLRCIVAIHSTAIGPSLGGTRFYPYTDEWRALDDVLALSQGMSYKAALAGLDLGGGKAVILGDPRTDKTEELLRAYGSAVQSLGGRYVTACDVGTYPQDMDVVAQTCAYVSGRSEAGGGLGDSSVLTAYGVLQGMRAAAQHVWGEPGLTGRRVGVAGVGKVGRHLVDHLVAEGATVLVTDVDAAAVRAVVSAHPQVETVADTAELVRLPLDVYAPCALGGALDDATVEMLRAAAVCGGANNQLAHPGVEKQLRDRGIVYAPDYCVNAGGLVQVAAEREGSSIVDAREKVTRIYDTTFAVLTRAAAEGVPPSEAADSMAEQRMAQAAGG